MIPWSNSTAVRVVQYTSKKEERLATKNRFILGLDTGVIMAINYPSGHLKFQVAIKNRQDFEERLDYRLT